MISWATNCPKTVNPAGMRGFASASCVTGRAASIREADRPCVYRFLDRLELCLRATSLGDVYTLVAYPAMASHREVPPAQRRRLGITDGLVRVSVGIEHVDDIIADLAQALDSCLAGD